LTLARKCTTCSTDILPSQGHCDHPPRPDDWKQYKYGPEVNHHHCIQHDFHVLFFHIRFFHTLLVHFSHFTCTLPDVVLSNRSGKWLPYGHLLDIYYDYFRASCVYSSTCFLGRGYSQSHVAGIVDRLFWGGLLSTCDKSILHP
jgi:hypothetical protein